MSTNNQISIVIPQNILNEVTSKLQECKTALAPYLQGLTADDRITMLKLGNKTVATVQKTKSYLDTNPEFAPAYMDKAEFLKDEATATQLSPIENLAHQLATDISDTIMLAGSEALYAALLYYGQVKEAHHKGIATAKPIYEDLSQRFAKTKRKSLVKP
jgi:phage gpG-like protein